jgi:hypothetical protein
VRGEKRRVCTARVLDFTIGFILLELAGLLPTSAMLLETSLYYTICFFYYCHSKKKVFHIRSTTAVIASPDLK